MASDFIVFLGATLTVFALSADWPLPLAGAAAVLAGVIVVLAARRLRIAGREGAQLFSALPSRFFFSLKQTPGRWQGAMGVFATALDLRQRSPAFVRFRLRSASSRGVGAVAQTLSATPGLTVIDVDAQSILAHALFEDAFDVTALQALERAALASAGEAS